MNVLLFIGLVFSSPNDTLRLEQCYNEAVAAYPLSGQTRLYENITQLKLKSLNAKFLPELSLTGQAAYQSEVTAVPIQLPTVSVPKPDKDAYQLTLNGNQLIFDFGSIAKQKAIEESQKMVDQKNVETELYKLRAQVNDAYFGLLLVQEQEKSLQLTEEDIRSKLAAIESRVKNGAILPSNADILNAELLRVRQNRAEAAANRKTLLTTLKTLLHRDVSDSVVLIVPDLRLQLTPVSAEKRPEYATFAWSQKRLDRYVEWTSRRNLPKISAFGQYSYGQPGLNMYEKDFHTYYVVGLRATWNFWNWNTDGRDRQVFKLQQDIIRTQKESFTQNLTVAAEKFLSEMKKMETLIKLDHDIIALRKKVTQQLSSQLDNGVVTSSEYLTELNSEHQARLTLEVHKLQWLRAQQDYLTTIGE